jgi:3'-5' exonuclease
LPAWGSEARPKPLFPVETPDTEEGQLLLNTETDLPSAPAVTWITLVGQISGIRRISKRLVFCDLLPPGFHDDETGKGAEGDFDANEDTKAWRSATDGKDLQVQLICGATICDALGEVQGQAALKGLRSGLIVLVQAKINVYNSRDSLERWVSSRRLDLVLVSYQVLHQSPTSLHSEQGGALQTQNFNRKPNKPYLRWEDVLSSDVAKGSNPLDFIKLVDDGNSLEGFSKDVLNLLEIFETHEQVIERAPEFTEGNITKIGATTNYAFVGIDCEWKPGFYLINQRETQPVLLLQISIHDQAYLLDLQSLARPLLAMHEAMTPAEQLLNEILEKVFLSTHLFKVGFQVEQDLQKLAVSYPHIPAFQEVCAVLEAGELATKVVRLRRQKNARLLTSSLSRLTEHFLGRSVNKDQQVSDWSARPLTNEQIEYAALDALVTPILVAQFFEELDLSVFLPGPEMGRWIGDAPYAKFLASFKFLFLQPDTDVTVVKKLKAKSVLSNQPLLVVTQTWTTAEDAPKLPSVPEDDVEGRYTDVFGIVRVPSNSIQIKPMRSLEVQSPGVSSLVGQRAGKSKEMCLLNLLEATLVNCPQILPKGARLQYPGRAGYVEFDDGVALFVNMPEKISANGGGIGQPRSYPNVWIDGGRQLTWFLRDREWLSGTTTLAKKLLDPSSLIVLFVRVVNKNYFLCCGPCQVVVPETKTDIVSKEKQESWKLVQLNLILTEWEKLASSSDFLSLQ